MIREYKQSDLEQVVALYGLSVRMVATNDYSTEQIAAWAPDHPDLAAWATRLSRGAVFVCKREKQIVGFCRIDEDGLVDLLYVHPEFLRQGVAGQLMDRGCSWATNQGLRCLEAVVSVTARPFFESRGFNVVEAETIEHNGASFNVSRMSWRLNTERQNPR